MNRYFIASTVLLAGIIIGAGIFSLPYFAIQLGLASLILYLIFFAIVYTIVYFMYSDVVRSEEGRHRFAYFSKKFLPKGISSLAPWVVLASMVFALTIYIILAPSFASLLIGQDLGVYFVLFFWLVGSVFIFGKIVWIEIAEVLGILSILAIVAVVFLSSFSMPLMNADYFRAINPSLFLMPFGAVIFAFAGRPAIAKMVEIWREAKKAGKPFSLKGSIIAGTFLPAVIYFFFVIGILKLGPTVTPEGLDSIVFLSPAITALLGFMGIITLWTSYFIVGLNVKEILEFDLKMPKPATGLFVVILPILLYFLGVRNFILALSIAGGLFAALEVFFIVFMWNKASRKAGRLVSMAVLLVFSVAIISVFAGYLK